MAYDMYRYLTIQECRLREFKWLESERRGQDIGDQTAIVEWKLNHGQKFNDAFVARQESIDSRCDKYCGEGLCRGTEECPYTNDELFKLLYK